MTDADIRSVLAQMARAGGAASKSGVVTPARALRLSLTRAVEGAAGLKVTVLSVSEAPGVLDDVVAAVGTEDLVLGLNGAGGLLGVAVLDRELRSAFVEAQTMGRLSTMPAPDRPVSVADAALATPVVDAFLVELSMAAGPTALDGWTTEVSAGARVDGARGTGLKLAENTYRIATMTVDLGIADREGRLTVALPMSRAPLAEKPNKAEWSVEMEKAVLASSASLRAVLHRLDLPLDRAESLNVGDVLPLGGASLGALRLEAEGGLLAGHARLGQVHGMKAVRVGPPAPPEMIETPSLPTAARMVASDPPSGVDHAAAQTWSHDPAAGHADAAAAQTGYDTAATAPHHQAYPAAPAPEPAYPAQPHDPGVPPQPAAAPEQYAQPAAPEAGMPHEQPPQGGAYG